MTSGTAADDPVTNGTAVDGLVTSGTTVGGLVTSGTTVEGLVTSGTALVVQQPSRHFPLNLAKIPPNQVIADFGRGSSVESESE